MKFLGFFAALIIGAAAFADAKVGDFANFEYSMERPGAKITGMMNYKLTSYDQATDSFIVTIERTTDGQATRTDSVVVPKSQFATEESLIQLLKTCKTPEKITIPAGQFDSCRTEVAQPDGQYTIWSGVTVFQFYKQVLVRNNGERFEMTMKEFGNRP